MRVAIAFDWTNQFGGAERVVVLMGKIFPQSVLFTSVFLPEKAVWAKSFKDIRVSFLNKFPFAKTKYYFYFYLLPLAFESFNFDGFNLVVSVTSFPAKFILVPPGIKHICYLLNPTRFLWDKKYPFLSDLRRKDYLAAQRPDYIVTTCKNVQNKIKKIYQRTAEIIYPGVAMDKFKPINNPSNDYFLIVSRLVEYKRIDLAIKAFNKLGLPLKIVGAGRDEKKLKRQAKQNIEFLGRVSDSRLISLYQNCRAVIFPQEEDFGLVPIEAQACGKPVIAYGKGGVLETIIPGKTGILFSSQTEESLLESISKFNSDNFKSESCRQNAKRFSEEKFLNNFKNYTERIFK